MTKKIIVTKKTLTAKEPAKTLVKSSSSFFEDLNRKLESAMIYTKNPIFHLNMIISSQIKSLQHPIIKYCVSLRKDSSFRKETGSLLITGKKEILELPSHVKILSLFTLDNNTFNFSPKKHYIVTEEILKKITGLIQPDTYAAEIAIPSPSYQSLQRVLVCDEITDPGNLGTLLRTALAFGFDGVFLLNHCVDPFNEKTLRAAKGAIFYLPLFYGDWEFFLSFQKNHNLTLYQADLKGKPFNQCLITPPFGLVLGNEAHGTSKQIKNKAIGITIPMAHHSESLNVAIAGGILMFNTSHLCQKSTTI